MGENKGMKPVKFAHNGLDKPEIDAAADVCEVKVIKVRAA